MNTLIHATDTFEKAIIGSLITLSPDEARELAIEVDASLFHHPRHKHAYQILRRAAIDGSSHGRTTAIASIESSPGLLEYYGGDQDAVEHHLEDCIETANPAASWRAYAQELKLAHTRRVLSQAFDDAQIESATAGNVIDATSLAINRVIQAANDLRGIAIEDETTIDAIKTGFLERYEKEDDVIPFPQSRLNTIGGYRPGNIVVLGAYTGVGKTWVALDWALSAALEGRNTMLYSIEVNRHEIMERLLAMHYGMRHEDLIQRNISPELVEECVNDLSNLPITILDGPTSPDRIMTDILALGDNKPQVLIIDHLHLLEIAGKDYRHGLNNALTQFKSFCVEHNIAMILVAQLARPDNRGPQPPPPSIYMLKESGAIEQIADFVIFLHRRVEDHHGYEEVTYSMWTDKQRQGIPADKFQVRLSTKGYRFR